MALVRQRMGTWFCAFFCRRVRFLSELAKLIELHEEFCVNLCGFGFQNGAAAICDLEMSSACQFDESGFA
jgi:hypothetical protein